MTRVLLVLVLLLTSVDQVRVPLFRIRLTPSTVVTESSSLSWDAANLTDVAGYKIQIDGGSFVDVGIPAAQTPLAGGGLTFTISVSALSLTNGAHTLLIYAYNDAGTLSSSPASLNVVKS